MRLGYIAAMNSPFYTERSSRFRLKNTATIWSRNAVAVITVVPSNLAALNAAEQSVPRVAKGQEMAKIAADATSVLPAAGVLGRTRGEVHVWRFLVSICGSVVCDSVANQRHLRHCKRRHRANKTWRAQPP